MLLWKKKHGGVGKKEVRVSAERFDLRRVVVFSGKRRERSVSFLLHESGRGWEIASLRKAPPALESALSQILLWLEEKTGIARVELANPDYFGKAFAVSTPESRRSS